MNILNKVKSDPTFSINHCIVMTQFSNTSQVHFVLTNFALRAPLWANPLETKYRSTAIALKVSAEAVRHISWKGEMNLHTNVPYGHDMCSGTMSIGILTSNISRSVTARFITSRLTHSFLMLYVAAPRMLRARLILRITTQLHITPKKNITPTAVSSINRTSSTMVTRTLCLDLHHSL